jgi:hypothetical protein
LYGVLPSILAGFTDLHEKKLKLSNINLVIEMLSVFTDLQIIDHIGSLKYSHIYLLAMVRWWAVEAGCPTYG